jgi:hypothetical protein
MAMHIMEFMKTERRQNVTEETAGWDKVLAGLRSGQSQERGSQLCFNQGWKTF